MILCHCVIHTGEMNKFRLYLLYITFLLLLISMLWHRQAIFESKGDKLFSSAECRILTHQGIRHQIASRLNARWQTDWAIEDQAKNLNSTARTTLVKRKNCRPRSVYLIKHTTNWLNHIASIIQHSLPGCCLPGQGAYRLACWQWLTKTWWMV